MTLFDIAYDDFKREDTTNTIVITLYTDDRQPITLDASHTWKAKVSKEDKYVGEYPVTISGNTIKLSSSNLTRLPNGDYGLELWETYSGSTTIYPSAGVMEFRVHRNANDTLGTVDPTTDINGIIDDLHKAGQNIKVVATNTLSPGSKASVTQSIINGENQLTFYIPQGNKGDVGPAPTLKVGTVTKLNPDQAPTVALTGDNGAYTLNMGIPQGETNETATNALKVANSVNDKVSEIQANGGGRNLLQGTIPTDKNNLNGWSIDNGLVGTHDFLDSNTTNMFILRNNTTKENFLWSPFVSLENGETYTLSYYSFATSNTLNSGEICATNQNYSETQVIADAKKLSPSGAVRYVYTFTFNHPSDKYQLRFDNNGSTNGSNADMYIGKLMFEKGTVAHDYQPAPEDVDANTDTKISDLQIGGINLLKDTDKMTNTNYWGLRGGGAVRAMYGSLRAKETGVSLSDYNINCNSDAPYIDYIPQVSFEQGTDYTISFWATIVDAPILYLNATDGDNHQHGNSQQNISLQANGRTYNGWKQVTATFKPKVATAYLTFAVSAAWVSSFKLEKGNKATDWQPAPDDIQTQLDALKEAVKKLGGTI